MTDESLLSFLTDLFSNHVFVLLFCCALQFTAENVPAVIASSYDERADE